MKYTDNPKMSGKRVSRRLSCAFEMMYARGNLKRQLFAESGLRPHVERLFCGYFLIFDYICQKYIKYPCFLPMFFLILLMEA